MDVNNLTNVYNQNPTLQSSYTLQQYLDLFGGSSTPANTTTATTTTPTTNASQGIINQNINQYQNQGGGGGGIGGLTLNAPRTTNGKTLTAQGDYYTDGTKAPEKGNLNFLDKTVRGIGSAYKSFKQSPIGIGMSFMNPVSAMASVAGMMGRKDVSEIDAAFNKSGAMYTSEGGIGNKDKYGINKVSALGNYADYVGKTADKTAEAYAAAVEKYTKMGLTPTQIATKTKNLRERNEFYEAEKKRRNDERMEASAANRAQANKISNRLKNEYEEQKQRDGKDFSVSGPETSANPKSTSNQASSERGYQMHGAKGGRVGYNDGGSTNGSGEAALSAKVKELMDDGYEFGEAVKEAMKQGYMNGGRIKSYFKGGLVSLRGR